MFKVRYLKVSDINQIVSVASSPLPDEVIYSKFKNIYKRTISLNFNNV